MSYLSRDRSSAEMYLSLLSDWDLDVAFMSAAKPFLQLKMDVKPSEDSKFSFKANHAIENREPCCNIYLP